MPKNFNDVSCFFCGNRNDVRDESCTSCTRPLRLVTHLTGEMIDKYILREYKGRGYYGVTYAATDQYGKEFALKLLSQSSYTKHGKNFSKEAELHAKLPDTPSIVNYVGAGETTVALDNEQVHFFYIASEWVSGETFRDFITAEKVTPEDLIIAARDLLLGLEDLYENNLWHNDLHDENVMVEPINTTQMRRFSRTIPRLYKIIDVGSMVYRNPADTRTLTDMVNVGHLLYQISEKLKLSIFEFSKEDALFIDLFDATCTELIDEHPTRSFAQPIDALNQIEDSYRQSRLGSLPTRKKLDNPYGYINANDIPSPWLLKHMFSDKLEYLSKIMSISDQCILIHGPRGSGKTMILKNMRFVTLYDSQEEGKRELLKSLPYLGIFISARTAFGNLLVSIREQNWIDDEAKVFLYFNILVSIEVIDILYRLSFDGLVEEKQIQPIINLLSERFTVPFITLFTAKTKLIEISRRLVSDKEVQIGIENSSPAFLNDLLLTLRAALPIVRDKELFILIDDFSLPRIPVGIQKSILPAIFNTGANYKIRISTHSDGMTTQDHAGEVYRANRDYIDINLGYEYWQLSDNYDVCRRSFDDILSKRFELAGRGSFMGLETMLGRGAGLGDIGREIHRLSKAKKLRTLKYHGAEVFIKLCSGDLSYLLDILGKMELRADQKLPIPVAIQNKIIRDYARNELRSLQDIRSQYNYSLFDIAHSFGVWSKSKLVKHDADYIRIEFPLHTLPENLQTAARELLCYGIFIDGGFSNMSDGGTARKLLFRRIFTPAFPTSFNDRNTFPMYADSFKEFIEDPRNFVRRKMSADHIAPNEQLELEQLDMTFELDDA